MNDKFGEMQSPHKKPTKRQRRTVRRLVEALSRDNTGERPVSAKRAKQAIAIADGAEAALKSAEQAEALSNRSTKAQGKAQAEALQGRSARALGKALASKTIARTRTRRWQSVCLDALRACPNFTYAAKLAGVARETIIAHRLKNPKFAARVDEALAQGAETLEVFCWQRATQGVPKPIFGRDAKGNPIQVGTVTEYSDRLAEVMLKAHLRDKYNPPQQTELSGPNGTPLAPLVAPTQVQIIIPDNGRSLPEPVQAQLPPVTEETGQGS